MQRYMVKLINNKIVLEDGDFHHIKDVMRLKSNDKIICVCNNKTYLCEIIFSSISYDIKIIEEINQDVELNKEVILYQAVIKNDKFDFVVQKATELGASAIVPTIFTRSVVKIDNHDKEMKKLQRYEKIIKEACEQSHRTNFCRINPYISVMDIKLDDETLGLLAYEGNNNPYSFNECLNKLKDYQKVAIIIGPEGGFSKQEVDYLLSIGFNNVSLGKRILRSETASLYALSLISYYLEGYKNE